MYIMCAELRLLSALSHGVGALRISIIIIIGHWGGNVKRGVSVSVCGGGGGVEVTM